MSDRRAAFARPPAAKTSAEVIDELRLDFVHKTADRAALFARGLANAARRRDKRATVIRARQLCLCTAALVETCDEIEREAQP